MMLAAENVTGAAVDAYSSGNFLPAAFARLGARLVHVQSTPEMMTSMLLPDLSAYVDNLVFEDEGSVVETLSRYEPRFVIAGQEPGVPLADRLSERMGLPTNGSRLSSARRDKYSMIETLRAAGLRCARQFKSRDPDALAAWADRDGIYPCVVKPLSSASTDGVYVCNSRADVLSAARLVLDASDIFDRRNHEALVQSYLNGTEYIVDTVSYAGQRYVVGIWEYVKSFVTPTKKIYDRDLLLAGDVSPAPEMIEYVDRVLAALGIQFGPTHAEVIMTEEGPALVEIGARLNGSMHPEFHDVCLGANQADLTALAYVDPDTFCRRYGGQVYTRRQEAVVYDAPTDLEGTVRAVDEDAVDRINALPTVHTLMVKLKPGSRIRPTIDLLSSPLRVFMTGPTQADVMRDYEEVRRLKDTVYLLEGQPPVSDASRVVGATAR